MTSGAVAPSFSTNSVRLDSLTGLRWWAAFAVFIFHMRVFAPVPWLSAVAPYGNYGVAFFFVLSGFVLTYSARSSTTTVNFYWRRFARIYPSHFVALLLAIPVFYSFSPQADQPWVKPVSISILLLSLLLLQGWSNDGIILFSGNPAAWTLTVEAFFYFMHPWLSKPMKKLKKRGTLVLVIIVALVLFGYRALAVSGVAPWIAQVPLPISRLAEFVLGMAIAHLVLMGVRLRIAPTLLYLALAGFILAKIVADFLGATNLATVLSEQFLAEILICFFVVIIFAVATRDVEQKPSLMRHPWLVKLGTWSFAFYLVHATVMYTFAAVFGVQPAAVSNLLWYAPVFGVGLLLAWLLYRFVEHPVEAKMRRFGNKKFQHSAA